MATVTKLAFEITSTWKGKGVEAARADIRRFTAQLAALSNTEFTVDLRVDAKTAAAEEQITKAARDRETNIRAKADTRAANTEIDRAARDRVSRIKTDADTAAARADLDSAAKNRTSKVNVDTSQGQMAMQALRMATVAAVVGVGALVAAFYLLGQTAVIVGALLATALVGGVIIAGVAAIAMNNKLSASYRQATASAQMAAFTANNDVAKAYQNVSDTASNGALNIEQAQRRVQDAERSSLVARQALTQAYKDAGRALEDLNLQLKGAPLTEKAAELAVARARQHLVDLGKGGASFTWIDVAESQNNIDQALQNLDSVKVHNRQLADDAAEANAKGIEGSNKVIDAKTAAANATRAEQDARLTLIKTERDASQANVQASEQLVAAQMRATEASTALTEALRKQNGPVAQLVQMFANLAEPLKGPLSDALDSVKAKFGELTPAIREGFQSAADLVKPFVDGLVGLATGAIPGVNIALANSGPIMAGFRDGMADLSARAGDMFAQMSKGADGLGGAWRTFGQRFGEFLQLWGDFLARFSGSANTSLDKMLDGINKLVSGMLAGLGPALNTMAGGTSIWFSLLAGIGTIFQIAGPALGVFTKALSDMGGPALDKLAIALGNLASALLLSLVPVLEISAPILLTLANAFSSLVIFLTPIMPVLGPVILGLWAVHAAVGPVKLAIEGLSKIVVLARSAWWAFNVVLIANPIGLAVVAAVALVAGITVLLVKLNIIKGGFSGLIAPITNFFKAGTDGVSPFMRILDTVKHLLGGLFGPSVKGTVEEFKKVLGDLKNAWETSIKPALEGLFKTLGPLWEQLKPVLAIIGVTLLGIAKIVWDMFTGAIRPVFGFITDLITIIINVIKAAIEIITGFLQTVKGVFELLFNFFKTVFGLIKGIFTGDWSTFGDGAKGMLNGLKDIGKGLLTFFQGIWHIIGAIWDTIFSIVKRAVQLVVGVIMGFVHGVVGFFTWLWDVLVGHSIIPDLMHAIVEWFTWLPKKVIALVMLLVHAVVDLWSKIWNDIKVVAEVVWEIIKLGFQIWVDTVKAILETVINWIVDAWNNFWSGLRDFFVGIVDWVSQKWNEFLLGVKILWEIVSTVISELWRVYWTAIKDTVTAIWDWIKNRWETFLNGVKLAFDVASAIISAIWTTFWGKIHDTAKGIWDQIHNTFTGFIDKIKEGFQGLVAKVNEIWDGIKKIFAEPVNFIIKIWNETGGKITGKTMDPITGYADGGRINGSGGSREDKHLVALSNREYVVNAEATSRNRTALDQMNFGGRPIQALRDGGPVRIPEYDPYRNPKPLSNVPGNFNEDIKIDPNRASTHIPLHRNDQGIWKPGAKYNRGYKDGGAVEWMTGQAHQVAPALQMTSGFRQGDPGYHGQGKAADFSNTSDGSDSPQMQEFANWIANTWGAKTLELIHSPFNSNIKNGNSVGDGMAFYGASTMAEHKNHVHWAVDGPLDESKDKGIFGAIGDAISGVVNGARSLVSDAFKNATNPLLDAIPDPALAMKDPFGSFPKGTATKLRDDLVDKIKGSERTNAGGPIGGSIPESSRQKLIDEALKLTGTPPPGTVDEWERGMNTLVGRESGWNQAAINNVDVNAQSGTPSKGLAQVIDPTFNTYKVPGHDNIYEPVDNLAASIRYIKATYGSITDVQQANANMPPKGYATGTRNAVPGWAVVGEKGPEMVKFAGGEQVVPFDKLAQGLKSTAENSGLPQKVQKTGEDFITANVTQFTEDLTGGSVENGFIGQLFKQIPAYAQQVGAMQQAGTLFKPQWLEEQKQQQAQPAPEASTPQPEVTQAARQVGDTHFHVSNVDEALSKYKQQQREQSYAYGD